MMSIQFAKVKYANRSCWENFLNNHHFSVVSVIAMSGTTNIDRHHNAVISKILSLPWTKVLKIYWGCRAIWVDWNISPTTISLHIIYTTICSPPKTNTTMAGKSPFSIGKIHLQMVDDFPASHISFRGGGDTYLWIHLRLERGIHLWGIRSVLQPRKLHRKELLFGRCLGSVECRELYKYINMYLRSKHNYIDKKVNRCQ